MMPKLAAENRGFLKNSTLSIGWSDCDSHHGERARARRPRYANATEDPASLVQPVGRPFDDAVHERHQTDDRQHRADEVEAGVRRDPSTSAMRNTPATSATTTIGMFTRKIEPQ